MFYADRSVYQTTTRDAKQQIENWLQWPFFSWDHDEEDNHWVIVNVENATQDKNALKNYRHGYIKCVNDRITDLSDINYEEWDPKAKEPSKKSQYKDWIEQRGKPWGQSPWDRPNDPYTNPQGRYNGKPCSRPIIRRASTAEYKISGGIHLRGMPVYPSASTFVRESRRWKRTVRHSYGMR
jgi:hypothetical protein